MHERIDIHSFSQCSVLKWASILYLQKNELLVWSTSHWDRTMNFVGQIISISLVSGRLAMQETKQSLWDSARLV